MIRAIIINQGLILASSHEESGQEGLRQDPDQTTDRVIMDTSKQRECHLEPSERNYSLMCVVAATATVNMRVERTGLLRGTEAGWAPGLLPGRAWFPRTQDTFGIILHAC